MDKCTSPRPHRLEHRQDRAAKSLAAVMRRVAQVMRRMWKSVVNASLQRRCEDWNAKNKKSSRAVEVLLTLHLCRVKEHHLRRETPLACPIYQLTHRFVPLCILYL